MLALVWESKMRRGPKVHMGKRYDVSAWIPSAGQADTAHERVEGTAVVHVAPNAAMSIPEGELRWKVRYGNVTKVRYVAASCLDSYAYLIGADISTKEAIRRLRLLRAAANHRSTTTRNEDEK